MIFFLVFLSPFGSLFDASDYEALSKRLSVKINAHYCTVTWSVYALLDSM